MDKPLNVFFAFSVSYIQHFTVAVTSLLENNKDLNLNILVIHDDMKLSEMDNTIRFLRDTYQTELNFVNVGHIDFSCFNTAGYFPKYTYFRLFLADIIPVEVDNGLFLDADLVVAGSIKELLDIDSTGGFIAAASEASVNDNVARLNELGVPVKGYFNAGVLLVNLKAWRREKLSEQFVAIANQYKDSLPWVDQDILNIYFANNWTELDKKFNAVHLIRKLPATPVIVHYASFSKPWYYLDTHPYNYLYQKYLRLTPFAGYKLTGFSLKNLIIKNGRLVKRQLREMGVLKYK